MRETLTLATRGPLWERGGVSLPPDDATPDQVVATAVRAQDRHDQRTLTALLDPHGRALGGLDPYVWVRLQQLGPVLYDRLGPGEGEGSAHTGELIATVSTSLTYRYRKTNSSIPKNWLTHGPRVFELLRRGPHGAWRIDQSGSA